MRKTLFILTILLLSAGNLLFAQNEHFTTSGSVAFNKTVNMYAQIQKEVTKENEDWVQPAVEAFKKSHPQFITVKSTLNFSGGKELFVPEKSDNPTGGFFDTPMASQNNTVYTDFAGDQSTVQKQVFEQTFLVKDTIRKIKWKITGETRDVAGYTCRRANGLLMDSIYVVAFYTDKIHVSGGPESFNGLPGMILEVALPHENVIWTATKVTDMGAADNTAVAPPKKGKPVNNAGLKATLQSVMKNWGDQAQLYLKGFLF
jgi:GLPGLI family protein